MRIFNVGIREVILLQVIMLILFGPRQLQENARKMAQTIRRVVRSDAWRTFLGLYDDVNNIKEEVMPWIPETIEDKTDKEVTKEE